MVVGDGAVTPGVMSQIAADLRIPAHPAQGMR
jgi:hypothetical protein